MSNNSNHVQKTLGEQIADLLRRKPKKFDVTFSVGPEKIKVEGVKFILEAASPVFETEFDEKWENGVMTDDNGIPLPGIEPTAFQLFVNLLILDAWSLDSLKSLNLLPNNLLNLLGLCRRYEITKAIQNLEEAADDFIQSFDKYKDTNKFLEISRDNLETIFSCENLPLNETEIFNCCCRWAENRCTIEGLEPTGENYREVLGGCLFQIRFPAMSTEEFTRVSKFKKNLLKGDEQLAIFLFIGSTNDEKTNYDKTKFPFKTNCRVNNSRSSSLGCSVLSLPPQYKITTSPPFVCNGSQRSRSFQVNQKIALHELGFLGPIDEDAHFDVSVQIQGFVNGSQTFASGTLKKNIFARKGEIFHFSLDQPIAVESTTIDRDSGNYYDIIFTLKGPNNTSQYKVTNPKDESLEASGVQFYLGSEWNGGKCGNPLAELLFKKI